MISKTGKYRDPVKNINQEFLQELELISDKIHPLAGATGRKLNTEDIRVGSAAKVGDETCFYEHIATVKHKSTNRYFVAFRETMDAFLARQMDFEKYPKWLMNNKQKQVERNIYIYLVTKHPKTIPILRSHEDWLVDFKDEMIFDAIAFFLSKHKIVNDTALQNLV
jgi:hypothetical protein